MKRFWRGKPSLRWLKGSPLKVLCLFSLVLMTLSIKPSVSLSGAPGDVSPGNKKAVVILANSITWDDLNRTELPHLQRFFDEATLALFSPRTAATNATI